MVMMGDGAGDLDCEPGVEFTEYVREHLSGFPPCSPMMCGSSKSRPTLWPGRRVKFTVKGKAQTAKAVTTICRSQLILLAPLSKALQIAPWSILMPAISRRS